jgi:hypothetical protein
MNIQPSAYPSEFLAWRRSVGITQDRAALILNVSTRTIARWDKAGIPPSYYRMFSAFVREVAVARGDSIPSVSRDDRPFGGQHEVALIRNGREAACIIDACMRNPEP